MEYSGCNVGRYRSIINFLYGQIWGENRLALTIFQGEKVLFSRDRIRFHFFREFESIFLERSNPIPFFFERPDPIPLLLREVESDLLELILSFKGN